MYTFGIALFIGVCTMVPPTMSASVVKNFVLWDVWLTSGPLDLRAFEIIYDLQLQLRLRLVI
jgi:hypothetical protein